MRVKKVLVYKSIEALRPFSLSPFDMVWTMKRKIHMKITLYSSTITSLVFIKLNVFVSIYRYS